MPPDEQSGLLVVLPVVGELAVRFEAPVVLEVKVHEADRWARTPRKPQQELLRWSRSPLALARRSRFVWTLVAPSESLGVCAALGGPLVELDELLGGARRR